MVRFLSLLVLVAFGSVAEAQPVRNVLKKCFGKDCQQQTQSAGYVVGQFDSDGATIISVGPVVDPYASSAVPVVVVNPLTSVAAPTYAPPVPAVTEASIIAQAPAGASARDFRSALLKAARQERGQSLTIGEYFAIFVGSLNPQKLEQAKLAVVDSAIQDGAIAESQAVGAIDWEKLIELIIKYLPMILDLFKK